MVNAGSILEDDDQRGLAHVVEHMAFNGTAHFKKQELVNYLESIGMRFGPDLNAYTSFDETVYMLQIPTDTPSIVEKSFEIMEDWVHSISFDDDQIDKERGVVIEEWRIGRGAGARMRDKQFPILFKNSRYAERLPIGEKSILDHFRHETLRRFYRTWYRPDLMAVIAVGDFDRAHIEELIRRHFSNVQLPGSPENRRFYPVPDHDETLFAIATDSEATLSTAGINYLREVEAETTEADYRRSIVEALYNGMLNERLAELTKKEDPPFLFSSSSRGNLVRTKGAYSIEVGVKDNGILRGIAAALTEGQRVKLFGFTQPELDRRKKEFLRYIQQAYNERDKTESDNFASELIRHYLEREPIPGIAYEFELYKKYLPTVTLLEVNRLAARWMSDRNRVILVNAPKKAGNITPSPEELRAVFDSVARKQLRPYVDTLSKSALLSAEPAPGAVVKEKALSEIGV
ncbi:MAG: insulinase family protein, partial [Ignavibacteria bacterium]